jgi:hypothetical protein
LARICENMRRIIALARVGRAILRWQSEEVGGISPRFGGVKIDRNSSGLVAVW